MNVRHITEYTIDFDQERQRLKRCFTGDVLARQLHLMGLAESFQLEAMREAYENLPYNAENECPEQEYVSDYYECLIGKKPMGFCTVQIGETVITQVI